MLGLTSRFTLTHTMGDKSGYDQTLSYDLSKASSPIDKGNIPECINAFVLDISHSSLIWLSPFDCSWALVGCIIGIIYEIG